MIDFRAYGMRKIALAAMFATSAALIGYGLYAGAADKGIPGWTPVNEELRETVDRLAGHGGDGDGKLQATGEGAETSVADTSGTAASPGSAPAGGATQPGGSAGQSSVATPVSPGAPAPSAGEASAPSGASAPGEAPSVPPPASPDPDGRIDLNRATQAELETLPGIGPSKAKAIVDYRDKLGGFRKIEQLTDVKGIGPKVFERVSPKIYVSSIK